MSDSKKIAIVSGGGRGIGAAIAREFGRRGYHVIVNYLRDRQAAEAVAAHAGEAIQADVTDEHQVASMVSKVRETHGRIDALVVNANTAQPPFGPVTTLEWAAFDAKVSGELKGAFFLTREVLKHMKPAGGGRIVYVSSTAADVVSGTIAHSTAKAALNAFSVQVAGEAAPYGIAVNTIASGAVSTPATAQVFSDGAKKYLADRSLTRQMLTPEEVGRTIVAVADGALSVATGQLIRVDGGFEVMSQQLDGLAAQFG